MFTSSHGCCGVIYCDYDGAWEFTGKTTSTELPKVGVDRCKKLWKELSGMVADSVRVIHSPVIFVKI